MQVAQQEGIVDDDNDHIVDLNQSALSKVFDD